MENASTTMSATAPSRLQRHGATVGQFAVVGMMFSMPLSRAIFNICVLFLVASWLASGTYRRFLPNLRENPALLMCVALFACVLVSVSYSIAPMAERWGQVATYSKLLYIPIMVGVLRDCLWIRRAWMGLFLGLTTLLMLFVADFWVNIPGSHSMKTGSLGVFNNTIVQGLQLATLALLGLYLWTAYPKNKKVVRCLLLTITVGAIVSVLFLNPARGAQLALLMGLVAFAMLYTSSRLRWIVGITTGLLLLLTSLSASNVTTRFEVALHEAQTAGAEKNTSVGLRLNAWRKGSEIWMASPWLGEGAGAYRYLMHEKYADDIGGCPNATCEQPHNQYMLTLVEQGTLGIMALLGLFWFCARASGEWTSRRRAFSSAFVLLFGVHSLFDSGLQMNTQVFVFIAVLGLVLSTARSGFCLGNIFGNAVDILHVSKK